MALKVEVIATGKPNRDGERSLGASREIRVQGIWPESSVEVIGDAATAVDRLVMVTRPRDVVLITDLVRYRGELYAVDGEPGILEDEGRIEGRQVRLRRGRG